MIVMEEITTYGLAKFYIFEGYYSIEEVEKLLAGFKEAKQAQDKALKKSMEKVNETTNTTKENPGR